MGAEPVETPVGLLVKLYPPLFEFLGLAYRSKTQGKVYYVTSSRKSRRRRLAVLDFEALDNLSISRQLSSYLVELLATRKGVQVVEWEKLEAILQEAGLVSA